MTSKAKKVAVITGAARGIGLATAEKFLAEGWRVALLDIDGRALKQSVAHLCNLPRVNVARVHAIQCDVAFAQPVNAAIKRITKHFGRIDALVNNAGTAVFKPLLDTTVEEWERVLAVNLTGPFICTQACAPQLIANQGSVVNIGSISGLRASTLRVAYGTSKAAVMHLTKQQAVELGNRGVRVNAIAPGPVDTAMAKKVHSKAIRKDYHDAIPLNRYGLESEIAAAIWFLCSPAASYVNGQVLAVDGGFDASGIGLPSLRGAD